MAINLREREGERERERERARARARERERGGGMRQAGGGDWVDEILILINFL